MFISIAFVFVFGYVFLAILSRTVTGALHASDNSIVFDLSAVSTKAAREEPILKSVVGGIHVGKLHAILGPSGSGKTTLLNILSNNVALGSLSLRGLVSKPQHISQEIFVEQYDHLFAQLSVMETLEIASALRMTGVTKDDQMDAAVQMMNKLGIKKAMNTKVGDAKTRGLSGGEKKRLSIGKELVGLNNENLVVFADEPTSGLDSFQAQNVMRILKDLTASDGHTVIVSIHQPRPSVYTLFDEITLLSEGQIMFSGSIHDFVPYFTGLGYPCPEFFNPAEFYIDLVSIDYSSKEEEILSKQRVQALAERYRNSKHAKSVQSILSKRKNEVRESAVVPTRRNNSGGLVGGIRSFFNKFRILCTRAWKQVVRDKPLQIARFMSGVFSALLFGAIYFKLGSGAKTVADRLGLLQVAAINTAMLALIKATTSFVSEKLIVSRERKDGLYSVLPYFLSKLVAEIPMTAFFPCLSGFIIYRLCGLNPAPGRLLNFLAILVLESMASTALGMSIGSLVPTVEAGVSIAPSVMVLFIVFGGLYIVNPPWYLKAVPNMSLIRWAYEALCVNEFAGMKIMPEAVQGALSVSTGEQVLGGMGYGQSTVKGALKAQLLIIVANYVFTYLSLLTQKPTAEPVRQAESKVEAGVIVAINPNSAVKHNDRLRTPSAKAAPVIRVIPQF